MAGSRVDMPLNGAADWSSFVDIVQLMMDSFLQVSLTNMGNDSAPLIESVSMVIVKGTCYKFASDETPTGWAGLSSDSEAYLYIVPNGATCTAEWSNTAPTWDSDYQGYYNGNNRCIGGAYKEVTTGNYKHKYLYTPDIVQQTIRAGSVRPILTKVMEIGDWDMDTNGTVQVTHALIPARIRSVRATIRDDAGTAFAFHATPYDHTAYTTMGIHYIRCSTVYGTQYISVERVPSGLFDSIDFNSTSYNRGWLLIEYEA